MSWSDATASPDFKDVRRTATLEALASNEFAPGSTRDEDSAEFAYDPRLIWQLATADLDGVDRSVDDPVATMVNRIIAAPEFATAWIDGSVDLDAAIARVRTVFHTKGYRVRPVLAP